MSKFNDNNLPDVPDFAVPHITCGSSPNRTMNHNGYRTTVPQSDHCGGCGWVHERRDCAVGPYDSVEAALNAVGLRRAHVAVGEAERVYAVGMCCRDVRESGTWHAHRLGAGRVSVYYADPFRTAADIATEEWSEKLYASSYGLGL